MALNGFDEEQVKDAAWAVQSVTGASAYIYATQYDHGKFREELRRIVDHVQAHAAAR